MCVAASAVRSGATGGGGGWHKASVSDCLPLAAPIGLSPLLILTLCGSGRVLVVSTEPLDDLSCLTTPGGWLSRRRAVARAGGAGARAQHVSRSRLGGAQARREWAKMIQPPERTCYHSTAAPPPSPDVVSGAQLLFTTQHHQGRGWGPVSCIVVRLIRTAFLAAEIIPLCVLQGSRVLVIVPAVPVTSKKQAWRRLETVFSAGPLQQATCHCRAEKRLWYC